MQDRYNNEPMMEMFLFESNQQVEELEKILLKSEETGGFSSSAINEIFRIMHTIKSSAAMMMLEDAEQIVG